MHGPQDWDEVQQQASLLHSVNGGTGRRRFGGVGGGALDGGVPSSVGGGRRSTVVDGLLGRFGDAFGEPDLAVAHAPEDDSEEDDEHVRT